jgi:hypothetical protein
MMKSLSYPASTEPIASAARLSISQFFFDLREIVDRRQVNYAVTCRIATLQTFQFFRIAAMHLRTGRGQRLGGGAVRASPST